MAHNYLRYPDIHGDLLTFVAADDVWLAPVTGGRGWRLSADQVPVESPCFSPTGEHVAWMSTRDGHQEVYVAPTAGGDQRRLTWLASPRALVLGWTPEGRVVVASPAGQPTRRDWIARAVSLDGEVEELPYGPTSGLAFHPAGHVALVTPYSRPPAAWKRYRGGTAPRLWLQRSGAEWERLLRADTAGVASPSWVGDQLIFASDRAATFPDHTDEQANLWALDALGSGGLRQLTRHTIAEGYVRDPRTDGHRIVYHALGRVYVLDSLDDEPRRIPIELGGSLPTRAPRALKPTEALSQINPNETGDASVLEWRGKIVWLPHRDGPARILAGDASVRYREPRIVPGAEAVLWVSDAGGGDRLEYLSVSDPAAEPRVVASAGLGRVLHLAVAPGGQRAAAITHDGRVLVCDIESGAVNEVGTSPHGEAVTPAWSPDGRFLVWSQPTGPEGSPHQLMVSAEGAAAESLTSGRFNDFDPNFSVDGLYLAFLSARTFDPAYDEHVFDMGFSAVVRPYLAPLDPAEPAPFGPSLDGWRISQPDDKDADKPSAKGAEGQADTKPDLPPGPDLVVAGFEDRAVPFPVPSAEYADLQPAKDGFVWVRESPERGELGTARAGAGEKTPNVVEFYSFPKRACEVVVDKVSEVAVSQDGRLMVVRAEDAVTVVPTDQRVSEDAEKVEVDLSRLRLTVDPRAEWRQMFAENHRLMAQHYWRADMNGVDWDAVGQRYRAIVDRLASHDDLVDLLWETVGELNSSHAYIMPPQPAGDQSRKLGLLGADFSKIDDGWRIDRILMGESSDPDARSPLRGPGVAVAEGDVLIAVDGVPIDSRGPNALLEGAVDKPVALTVRSGGTVRRTVVLPVASETPLRYQEWVKGRIDYVREHSDGRLGYVHIPDMVASGWAQLHRNLRAATAAEGLVVDVRGNSGGHTSELVLDRLVKRVLGWDLSRHMSPTPYPNMARRGPVVFITNEHAGSDGDIISAAVQELALGPVIGVRSWGGVIGIDGRFDLVDGTVVTQPRYSFWFNSSGWDVENWGVEPDIVVEHSPADYGSADHQLDRAIAEALDRLSRTPASVPPPLPEPRTTRRHSARPMPDAERQ